MGWTSILSHLFWCELQGLLLVLTHEHHIGFPVVSPREGLIVSTPALFVDPVFFFVDHLGGSIGGTPIAGWLIIFSNIAMENPVRMDDLGVPPWIGNLHFSTSGAKKLLDLKGVAISRYPNKGGASQRNPSVYREFAGQNDAWDTIPQETMSVCLKLATSCYLRSRA